MVTKQMKQILIYGFLTLAGISGCGDGDETKAPAIKLTASVVQSGVASPESDNHTHSVTIQFTDPGNASQVNYLSSAANGHSHTIALSNQQFNDLKSGMRVVVKSTSASDGHTHTWNILGGNYLYESMCYNCHSNDKRGSRGMSNTPDTTAQRDALQNPSAAPLSSTPPADPTITPGPTPTDGAALYTSNCSAASCHRPLASSNKKGIGVTAVRIRSAINANSGGMSGLAGLTDAQLQAIATALQ